jgi:hypothetical protein
LQADKAQKLATLNESLNRRQVALDHAQANNLGQLSNAQLLRREFDSALRLAARGTRIDLALPGDKTRASPAATALAAGGRECGGHSSRSFRLGNSKFASKRNQGPVTLPRDRRENEAFKQAWARRHEQHCLAAIEMLDH